jgi:serine/threonine protein kinase
METALPSTIGSYQVVAKLGEGGMASVYLGMALGKARFRKLVVTKALHPTLCGSPEFVEMFLSEARVAAQLNHPNVVNTYEVGEDQGRPFIAMEYLEGQSYWSLLKKVGRSNLALETHLEILIDALAGLHYAHELVDLDGTPLGMVHRDVSPQNIFVTYDGQVKLLDFGLAKASCVEQKTRVGVIKGKIAYLAPEQATNGAIDRRTDIFAVGVMLWEALAARRFSTGDLDVATIHKRISGAEPRIRTVIPEVPPDLADACDRALAVKPEERFATAEEMRSTLLGALERRWHRNRTRKLAAIMADVFSDERSSIRSIVERYARAAEEKSNSKEIQPRSRAPGEGSNDGLDVPIDVEAPPPLPGTRPPPPPGTRPPPLPGAPTRSARPKQAAFVGVLLVALLAATAISFLAGREKGAAPPPLGAAPAARAKPAPAPPEADGRAKSIELVVVTSPPEAQAFVDGVAVQGNPIRMMVDRDERMHAIRVEAPGYSTFERGVSFEEDLVIKASLIRRAEPATPALPTPAPRRNRSVAASKATPPPPSPTSRPPEAAPLPAASAVPVPGDDLRKGKPTFSPDRAIDDKDPYEP